jgi:hypothetical protein
MICHALVVMMCLVIIARMTVVFRLPRARRAINLKRHRKASVTCDTTLDHVYIEGFLLRSTTNLCLLTGVDRLTEGLSADESAEGNEEESGRPQRLAENTRIRSLY